MSAYASESDHCRVLLAEDALIVAEMVETVVRDCHCTVVGPFATVDEALNAAREEAGFVGALLDVNLDGDHVFPVAEALQKRGIPIIFLTGYDREILPPLFENSPVLEKPFSVRELAAAIKSVFALD